MSSSDRGEFELIERDRELAAIQSAVAALAGFTGAVVLVEGEAGTGKTRLLDVLAEEARRAGLVVSSTRATELDASLSFSGLRRMFEALLRSARGRASDDPRIDRALTALTSSARGTSALLAEGGTAALGAVIDGVEALVDRFGPLVVIADDAQWADPWSSRLLGYLSERARDLPIVLALAMRRGELKQAIAARVRSAGAIVLEARELSAEGTARLVRCRLPGASAEVVAACRRLTGGNPFLLVQLLAGFEAEADAADAGAVARIERLAPRTVTDDVSVRLGRLPSGAGDLARAIAVLGDGARLHETARLCGLPLGRAAELADALAGAGILQAREPLAYKHPLIAAAVLSEIGSFTRAELHRRAAELLSAEGDCDRCAVHLLHASATADPRVVAELRSAAAAAAARGDAAAARRLLLRALEEPPEAHVRADLYVELARAEAAVGDPQAVAHMDAAVAGIQDDKRAASVMRELARLHHVRGDYATAVAVAARALQRAGEGAPNHDRLRATWMLSAALNPPTLPAFRESFSRLMAETDAGAPPSDPELQAIVALKLIVNVGDPAKAARLAAAAVDGELRGNDDGLGLALGFALSALAHSGELRSLEESAGRALRWANQSGSVMAAATAAVWRGVGRLRRGDLDGAEADAEVALRPWRFGWVVDAPRAYALLARARLERGDRAGAAAAIAAAAAIDIPHPDYLHAAGLVRMAEGDASGALDAFRDAGRLLESVWHADIPSILPWRSAAALAALEAGMRREAAALAAAELAVARRTEVPAAFGIALRASALVSGRGRGIARLREALERLASTDDQLEAVRTHVELGAALRRAGLRREARAELAAARDRAERLGLPALAARAEEEQRASGARPRRARLSGAESLTPSERRIAERARAGASNRQIAAELFLTSKTVEWHLANVFRKLEISSREELTGALSDPSEATVAAR